MRTDTFIIDSDSDIQSLVSYIKNCPDRIEVQVISGKRSRSVDQNSLYWKWVTEIGNHLGMLKDETHEMLKRRFAIPILTRDNKDFAELVTHIKEVKKHDIDLGNRLAVEVTALLSTTRFTVEQMKEYLDNIQIWTGQEGIFITIPENNS